MRTDIFHLDSYIPPDGLSYPQLFNELDAISGGISEITPELAMSIGYAAAKTAPRIAVGYSECGICSLLANAFIAGAGAGGAKLTETDASFYAVAAYIARCYLFNLTVFFENDNGRLRIRMADKFGLPPEREVQRKIEFNAASASHPALGAADMVMPKRITGTKEAFALACASDDKIAGFPIAVEGTNEAANILRYCLASSGCRICDPQRGVVTLAVSDDGMLLRICDERERWLDDGHVTTLLALVHFLSGARELAVNASAPSVVEQIATQFDGRIMRIGRDCGAREVFLKQNILTDALRSAVHLCAYLSDSDTELCELVDRVPDFTLISREITVRSDRMALLAGLAKKSRGIHIEDMGELRFCTDGGWVNISPSRSKSALRITGEAMNEEIAAELCDLFVEKARSLDESGQK